MNQASQAFEGAQRGGAVAELVLELLDEVRRVGVVLDELAPRGAADAGEGVHGAQRRGRAPVRTARPRWRIPHLRPTSRSASAVTSSRSSSSWAAAVVSSSASTRPRTVSSSTSSRSISASHAPSAACIRRWTASCDASAATSFALPGVGARADFGQAPLDPLGRVLGQRLGDQPRTVGRVLELGDDRAGVAGERPGGRFDAARATPGRVERVAPARRGHRRRAERRAAVEALRRVLRERAPQHGLEARDGRRRLGQVRPQLRLRALDLEHGPSGQRDVQQAAERVQVGGGPVARAADALGRDVVERPHDLAGAGEVAAGVERLHEPEVGQVGVVGRGDEHVRGLDVAVHEPARVRGVQRRADLRDDRRRPRAAPAAPATAGPRRRRAASTATASPRSRPRRTPAARSGDRATPPSATRRRSARGSPARRARSGATTFSATVRPSASSTAS